MVSSTSMRITSFLLSFILLFVLIVNCIPFANALDFPIDITKPDDDYDDGYFIFNGNEGYICITLQDSSGFTVSARSGYHWACPTKGMKFYRYANSSWTFVFATTAKCTSIGSIYEILYSTVDIVDDQGNVLYLKDSISEPDEPDEPIEPEDPTIPSEPEEPDIESSEPSEPIEPIEPSEPSEPSEPDEPGIIDPSEPSGDDFDASQGNQSANDLENSFNELDEIETELKDFASLDSVKNTLWNTADILSHAESIHTVSDWFMDVWNSFGAFNVVFMLSLALGLVTFLLKMYK